MEGNEEQVLNQGDEPVVVDQQDAPKVDSQIEERAKLQGWVPKEEFRGDKSRWIPANDFVKRADEMMPILKSVNRKLEGEVTELKRKLSDTHGMVEKMVKIQNKYAEDFYGNTAATIKAQKLQAVESGDIELYKRLEEQEIKISKPEPLKIEQPASNVTDNLHPEVARWQQENGTWYGQDQELTEYADIIASRIAAKGHAMTPYQFCEEVGKKVKTMFPQKFRNPNQQRSAMDDSGLRGGEHSTGSNGQKTWNNLPNEAKQQCSRLLEEIPGYTKEKYLKDYYEGA